MASSIASSSSATIYSFHRKPIPLTLILPPISISFPPRRTRLRAVRAGAVRSSHERGAELLRKPVAPPPAARDLEDPAAKEYSDGEGSGKEGTWVDMEDRILEDTVPLVGFLRMIIHSGKYESGDRLSFEHERTILERVLPYHPEYENKIGPGVDYITIGYHPNFGSSRCLFIVRKDGELVDFSYWKCIKGLIRKNYPLHAGSFILRHFRSCRRD